MNWYLLVGLAISIGYALMLRKNVKLREDTIQLLNIKNAELYESLEGLKGQVKHQEGLLVNYINSVKKDAVIDTSKTGQDLINETNKKLGQIDLFDDDTNNTLAHVAKLPND